MHPRETATRGILVSTAFAQALIERIMEGTMIPKVQTEREVGPILDLFLEGLLTEVFREDPQLSGPIATVCREFPFKKPDSRQSTNIDWLMRNAERGQLIFVELKTADTSFDGEQSEIYRVKQEAIRDQGAGFLVDDLRRLRDVSGERGKYSHVLTNAVEPLRDAFAACREAFIVYLVPKSAVHKVGDRADRVLTFSDLPDRVSGPFAAEWEVIRPHLCKLDESSRATRNEVTRTAAETGVVNFAGRVDFDSIVSICDKSGDDVVVGFDGGTKALASRDLSALQARLFKWDNASGGSGRKGSANWIPGAEFLRTIDDLRARSLASRSTPAPRASSWEGTLVFSGMVDLCVRQGDAVVVGFTGGKEAFLKKRLVDLKRRPSYKWDFTENLAGKRRADWILGSEVVEMLAGRHHQIPGIPAEQ